MDLSSSNIRKLLLKSRLVIFGLSIDNFLSNICIKRIDFKNYYEIKFILGFSLDCKSIKFLVSKLTYCLSSIWSALDFTVVINININSHKSHFQSNSYKYIKNIVAISSCKGGVGKSIITANLARSLSFCGVKVGILDADIYGSSQPSIMGVDRDYNDKNQNNNIIEPFICDNIKLTSISNIIDINSSVIWRGPMISNALMYLLNYTNWGNIDYLLIDLPPGTGDIQLTMIKKIPITCTVLISTLDNLSIVNIKRSINMFRKTNISILGLIENMSIYLCEHCNNKSLIFGNDEHSLQYLCQQISIKYFGNIPLNNKISCNPYVNNWRLFIKNEHVLAKIYHDISLKITSCIAKLPLM